MISGLQQWRTRSSKAYLSLFSRRRLGDKAVVDRLASPYRFKNIVIYRKESAQLRN